MHKPESPINRNHLDPPLTPEVNNPDGKELHQTMVTAFAIVSAQGTATTGPAKDRKGK